MTAAHQTVAWLAVAISAAVLGAAVWSAVAGRRSGGSMDHRFAVDRAVIAAEGVIAVAALIGLAIVAGGSRPADALHLLYGVLAVVALPLGWLIGGRATPGAVTPPRLRRDTWIGVAAAILLAIELRLFLTG
ncbi:MAG TPA: hypothetical protein VFJ71_01650 [Candidatus Limnocylindrales bacterium]|nr:hypothetical protein [Candidatus Limnocylindrales bacterium]